MSWWWNGKILLSLESWIIWILKTKWTSIDAIIWLFLLNFKFFRRIIFIFLPSINWLMYFFFLSFLHRIWTIGNPVAENVLSILSIVLLKRKNLKWKSLIEIEKNRKHFLKWWKKGKWQLKWRREVNDLTVIYQNQLSLLFNYTKVNFPGWRKFMVNVAIYISAKPLNR